MAGRGRGGGPGSGQLKGATWEYDASIKLESKPSDLFPPHPNLKRPAPLTKKERREINNYKNLIDQVHRGPLYTQPTKRDPNAPAKTFGEDQFNRQYGTNRKADMDPFNGVETYSMRYAPKQRDLPKLSDQPFDKSLFPEELWSTLEGTEGQEVRNHINRAMQRKAALLNGKDKDTSLKTRSVLEKIHNAIGDDDNEELDEENKDEEERDDEYDDDEIGDDYNGEQYFDNGEDEMEDGDDGGEEY
ncbi:related to RPC31 DNA-directed RNA polymerase III, 31 KD subunit [Phialocephala subalpina]|uniref:DNA-directed RNA polymerase III subunit n=1 Tax=Phialocephala subalpina TaxID=576137 RepID=A0A1L7XKV1_9HELO|nr:related to RPC31 DNA-directed RNA polymerase III, 31 KD subunit [Phialocephala subalpina]